MKNIVRLGDTTDHGGVVTESIPNTSLNGKPMVKGIYLARPFCQ